MYTSSGILQAAAVFQGTKQMRIITYGIATWYVTYVVLHTDGPFNVFKWARSGRKKTLCFACLAFWVGALMQIQLAYVAELFCLAGVATAINPIVRNQILSLKILEEST